MKALKIISLLLITITFSCCYFLDRFIPEEYIAYEEPTHIKYIWISHPAGIQCEVTYFSSLENAIKSVTRYGIKVYDARIVTYQKPIKCGTPTSIYYNLRIEQEDVSRLQGTTWIKGTTWRNNKKPFVLY